MKQPNKYEVKAFKHINNRIIIEVDNLSTDERYKLDLTQKDFHAMMWIMKEYYFLRENNYSKLEIIEEDNQTIIIKTEKDENYGKI
ncbi:MAG: hypothetical protein HDQ88_04575 [Clostridia bacterium]|nr:hypothetical protein [Clostridia bacterium]